MITKQKDFNNNVVLCIQDFYEFMNKENLMNNGYSEEDATKIEKESIYKLFTKGEKYNSTGKLETLNGDEIIYVDSKLKSWNKGYIHTLFYVEERSKEHLEKIENFHKNYDKMNNGETKSLYDGVKKSIYENNKNKPIFSEYFKNI